MVTIGCFPPLVVCEVLWKWCFKGTVIVSKNIYLLTHLIVHILRNIFTIYCLRYV